MLVASSLASLGTASLVLLCGSALADETHDLFQAGADLSLDEVAALEEVLRAEPEDPGVRARLLGYYSGFDLFWDKSAQEKKHEHTLWFIRHAPESQLLRWEQDIDPCNNPAAYVKGKRLWLEHLEREPDNVAFYLHAAAFMSHEDSDLRIDLLREGQYRDASDPEWAFQLGLQLSFEIRNPAGTGAINIEAAKQSLAQYELAYELAGQDRGSRSRALPRLAEIALVAGQRDKAREYAELAVGERTA